MAAVSGGADSAALLLDPARARRTVAKSASPAWPIFTITSGRPMRIEDAAFVEALAGRLGLPFALGTRRRSRAGAAGGAVAGGRRPRSAARVLRAPGRRLAAAGRSPWRTPEAIRPKRCCCGWPVERGPGAWPAWRPATAPGSGPLLEVDREQLRDWLRERGRALAGGPDQRGRDDRRATGSAMRCCRSSRELNPARRGGTGTRGPNPGGGRRTAGTAGDRRGGAARGRRRRNRAAGSRRAQAAARGAGAPCHPSAR